MIGRSLILNVWIGGLIRAFRSEKSTSLNTEFCGSMFQKYDGGQKIRHTRKDPPGLMSVMADRHSQSGDAKGRYSAALRNAYSRASF